MDIVALSASSRSKQKRVRIFVLPLVVWLARLVCLFCVLRGVFRGLLCNTMDNLDAIVQLAEAPY